MSNHIDVAGLVLHGATKAATAHSRSNADRARRFVASMSADVEDCRLLLDALGLLPAAETAGDVPEGEVAS